MDKVLFYSNSLQRELEVEAMNLKANTFVVRVDKRLMTLDGADKLFDRIRAEAWAEALREAVAKGKAEWFRDTSTITWARVERAILADESEDGSHPSIDKVCRAACTWYDSYGGESCENPDRSCFKHSLFDLRADEPKEERGAEGHDISQPCPSCGAVPFVLNAAPILSGIASAYRAVCASCGHPVSATFHIVERRIEKARR